MKQKLLNQHITLDEKEITLLNSEQRKHNIEQHDESEYYKKLSEIILKYDDVLLFGPTEAKTELLNILRKDNHFANLNIEIQQSDKMTENEHHAFVKNYFSQS